METSTKPYHLEDNVKNELDRLIKFGHWERLETIEGAHCMSPALITVKKDLKGKGFIILFLILIFHKNIPRCFSGPKYTQGVRPFHQVTYLSIDYYLENKLETLGVIVDTELNQANVKYRFIFS